nr:putative P0 protein [Apple luteovirus 1]
MTPSSTHAMDIWMTSSNLSGIATQRTMMLTLKLALAKLHLVTSARLLESPAGPSQQDRMVRQPRRRSPRTRPCTNLQRGSGRVSDERGFFKLQVKHLVIKMQALKLTCQRGGTSTSGTSSKTKSVPTGRTTTPAPSSWRRRLYLSTQGALNLPSPSPFTPSELPTQKMRSSKLKLGSPGHNAHTHQPLKRLRMSMKRKRERATSAAFLTRLSREWLMLKERGAVEPRRTSYATRFKVNSVRLLNYLTSMSCAPSERWKLVSSTLW